MNDDGPGLSVTVAVPTRNRGWRLRACLEAIVALDYRAGFDVLVADNGSTDETVAIANEFARTSPVPMRCVSTNEPGLSNVRNLAINAIDRDVVAFIDDDCYPDRNWLTQLMHEFSDPRVGYVGGRVVLHDPTDAAYSILVADQRIVWLPGRWNDGNDIPGTGMALRRSALLQVRGYDPLLGAGSPLGSAEDTDMHWRLWADGWIGVFTPAASIAHHHGRKPGSEELSSLVGAYALGRGAWYIKRLLLGPQRARTLYTWGALARYKQPARITGVELRGAARYLRLILPKLVRGGRRALHPEVREIPPSASH